MINVSLVMILLLCEKKWGVTMKLVVHGFRKTTRRLTALLLALLIMVSVIMGPLSAGMPGGDAEAAGATPVSLHGRLSVNGTRLVDQYGQPFQIRGISTHGLGWFPEYNNREAYRTLRDDWNANCIRLAMYTEEYNGYTTGNRNGMMQQVKEGIRYATELGMYVIVDWHILNDGNPLTHKEEAKAFFAEMASLYKSNNNILYEICNEPNGCSWSDIKAYAQEVIPVIRQYDKNAVIIVGTPTWSQLGSAGHLYEPCEDPIRGYSNLMYTFHFYASDPNHNQWLKNKIPTAIGQYKIPVFVTEYGLSEANGNGNVDTAKATEWLRMCDNYGVSYCAWNLSNKNESSSLIQPGCTKTSGWSEAELTTAGRFIRNWYRGKTDASVERENNPEVKNLAEGIKVSYRTHVQTYGWQDWVENGKMSGTRGESKRLEGICITVSGNASLGIRYKTHVQTYGWQDWVENGAMSGTSGKAKRLEAICIELTGADKDKYDVYYRVHAQTYGWLGWAKNGAMSGTEGLAKRLEGINIIIVKKGASPGVSTSRSFVSAYPGKVNYRTHVQGIGWQGWKADGAMSGTSGQSKRLEAIELRLNRNIEGGIRYSTHVQSYGWQGWRQNGTTSGTSGQGKRLEAIRIELTGKAALKYDVYYRVHVQGIGWLGWAKNGEMSGTSGYAYRLEGIEVRLVDKDGPAPGSRSNIYKSR